MRNRISKFMYKVLEKFDDNIYFSKTHVFLCVLFLTFLCIYQ